MEDSVTIGELRSQDVGAVLKIGEECGLSHWSLEDYKAELKRTDSIQSVARINDQIIGFIVLRLITSINEAEIFNIAVRKTHQNKGIGGKLLQSAIQSCKPQYVWLEVRESNETAIKFYQTNGFVTVGKRKSFYTNPLENALLMKYQNTFETDPLK